jgi:hypothetical protein
VNLSFLASLAAATSLLTGLCAPARAQSDRVLPQATATARAAQRSGQVGQIRPDFYDLALHPLDDTGAGHWRNLLWTTAVVEPDEPYVVNALLAVLELAQRRPRSAALRTVVEAGLRVATQLHASDRSWHERLGPVLADIAADSPEADWVAQALSALSASASPEQRRALIARIEQRIPWADRPLRLRIALQDARARDLRPTLPPLGALFRWNIAPRQVQLYVLCRPDRSVLCTAIVRDAAGRMHRRGDGTLWSVPLLSRSLHGAAWNVESGTTPQGIYRVEGTRAPDEATFRAYGQFPRLLLYAPHEAGVREFIPGRPGTITDLSTYRMLLPPSFRNHGPLHHSYWAGRAGRTAFRIHGSGEGPDFFTSNGRHPETADWNPARGCLSARELYDADGRLRQADMPAILETFRQLAGPALSGYVIVLDLPGDDPVPLSFIEAQLRNAP